MFLSFKLGKSSENTSRWLLRHWTTNWIELPIHQKMSSSRPCVYVLYLVTHSWVKVKVCLYSTAYSWGRQRVLNIQRHHWTEHGGPSFGCHGDVLSSATITAHILADDTAPVYDHARAWIKTMRCIASCNSCHARTPAKRLGSAWKWLNCTPFPWQRNGTKMRCTRWYSRCGD